MSSRLDRIKNEMAAGGSVTEVTEEHKPSPFMTFGVLGAWVVLLGALAWYRPWAFAFVVGVLVSIYLHEVGHFVTARRSGMKVTQFFMGMGPRLWSFKRGDIEYGVRALPVGAFVRIVGMNNLDETDPRDEPVTYRSKSYPKRMLVITAGSAMHMIIAVICIVGVYAFAGRVEEAGRVTV